MALNRFGLASVMAWSLLVGALARAGMIHRYSFNDGTARDSVGQMDAQLKGDATIIGGKLVLKNNVNGTSDDANVSYLDFGGRVIPERGSVTLEAWFESNGTGPWSRLFDFGDTDGGAGFDYFCFSPHSLDNHATLELNRADVAKLPGIRVATKPLDDGKMHMVAVSVDSAAGRIHFYVDGKEAGSAPLGGQGIEHISVGNNWLGRSNFGHDPGLNASIDELRIYDSALGKEEVASDYRAGPNGVVESTTKAATLP